MAADPPPAPGKGKGVNFKSPVTWVIILGATAVIGGIYLWRRSQSGSASTTAAADTSATDGADTSGSDAGALGTLQTEIGDLQSSSGQIKVPNVTGATAAEATTIIKAAGLAPANPKGTAGNAKVTGTSPAEGTELAAGSTVSITSTAAKAGTSTAGKASERSWTDTGQKWTVATLAKKLGISKADLHPTDQAAASAYNSKTPGKLIPKGAHFTYTKAA